MVLVTLPAVLVAVDYIGNDSTEVEVVFKYGGNGFAVVIAF